MAPSFVASAPGKVLLLGGYSVLERPNKALVLCLDARAYAKAERLKEKKITISMPQFKTSASAQIRKGALVFSDFSEDEGKKLKFLLECVRACIEYLNLQGRRLRPFSIETWNDARFGITKKTGLGSSAAATVAAICAILKLHGFPISDNLEVIHKLSQIAHSRAQGKIGSGFDVACSAQGSIAYSRASSEFPEKGVAGIKEKWDYSMEGLQVPKQLRLAMAFTGSSTSTTEMVSKTNAFKEGKPAAYAEAVKQINASNEAAILAFTEICSLARRAPKKFAPAAKEASKHRSIKQVEGVDFFTSFASAWNSAREDTKALGRLAGAEIESEEMTKILQESERLCFVAKLPGAGGGDSIAALCLSKKSRRKIEEYWKGLGFKVLDVEVGKQGARKESQKTWQKITSS